MVSKYDRPLLAGHAFHWPIWGVQFICGILVLAFSSRIISNAVGNTDSAVNYTVFVGIYILVWCIATVAAPFFPFLGQEILRVPIDFLGWVFTLANGIDLAARLNVHSCNNQDYLATRWFQGSEQTCRLSQAMTFFVWLSFGAFTVTTIAGVISWFSGRPGTQRGSRKPRAAPATV
ncbi:hypothetical protein PYCC9005_001563 [Savitreella phatthalungensis]